MTTFSKHLAIIFWIAAIVLFCLAAYYYYQAEHVEDISAIGMAILAFIYLPAGVLSALVAILFTLNTKKRRHRSFRPTTRST